MSTVDFECPHGAFSLSIDQAESLILDLQAKVSRAKRSGITAWHYVDDNGMINRERFYQFFEQYFPERASLRNRAGKLYAAIVRTGMKSSKDGLPQLPILVICGSCGKPVISETDNKEEHFNHVYYRNGVDYLIDLHDVYRFRDAFLPRGACALVGPRKRADFQLLLDTM